MVFRVLDGSEMVGMAWKGVGGSVGWTGLVWESMVREKGWEERVGEVRIACIARVCRCVCARLHCVQ